MSMSCNCKPNSRRGGAGRNRSPHVRHHQPLSVCVCVPIGILSSFRGRAGHSETESCRNEALCQREGTCRSSETTHKATVLREVVSFKINVCFFCRVPIFFSRFSFQDQFAMLADAVAREKKELELREKAQTKVCCSLQ